MKKNLKLKHLIKYLEPIDHISIWQEDVYIDDSKNPEEIFKGFVMDIPWYLLDYYLAKGEGAISSKTIEIERLNGECVTDTCLEICIRSELENEN